jgi:acyl-coenzyme A synthetase/AMP-(fatty) acid ligase
VHVVLAREWVRERLRSSRVPGIVVARDALPYSETGKLLRRVLRSEYTEAPGPAASNRAPAR